MRHHRIFFLGVFPKFPRQAQQVQCGGQVHLFQGHPFQEGCILDLLVFIGGTQLNIRSKPSLLEIDRPLGLLAESQGFLSQLALGQ